MRTVAVRVPAKVNLQLSVGPARDDGYHDVANVLHAVSLFDEVIAEPADEITVTVEGSGLDQVPMGRDNLAVEAAYALAGRVGTAAGAALRIRKAIPVAGGMAGGSADAAATLVACNELWESRLSRDELAELATGLGSDVPFALLGGTAIGLGRGERLTPALARGRFDWVFAFAHGGLSTKAVYAECDRLRAARREQVSRPQVSKQLMAALSAGDPLALSDALSNDLQPAALSMRPQLARTLAVGEECGALRGIVSGSGPTCAFLALSEDHALDLAVALSGAGVCRSVARAHGPVQGAHIIDRQANGC